MSRRECPRLTPLHAERLEDRRTPTVTPLMVPNHSFESFTSVGGGSTIAEGSSEGLFNPSLDQSNFTVAPGWELDPAPRHRAGVFDPDDATFTGTTGNPVPGPADGTYVGAIQFDSGSPAGNLGVIRSAAPLDLDLDQPGTQGVQSGTEYRLRVAVGLPNAAAPFAQGNPPFRAVVGLVTSGGHRVEGSLNWFPGTDAPTGGAFDPMPIDFSEFRDLAVTLTADAVEDLGLAGQDLFIEMQLRSVETLAGGNMVFFDNVRLNAVTNSPPVIPDQTFEVAETSPAGTLVGQVFAFDPDAGQTLSFAITGGNGTGAFAVDPMTGDLTVADPTELDFEVTPTFALEVTVTDDRTPPGSSAATVTVNLIDVDESPNPVEIVTPTVSGDPSSISGLELSAAAGTEIQLVDPDGDRDVTLVLSVTTGDLNRLPGESTATVSGDGTDAITVDGAVSEINEFLNDGFEWLVGPINGLAGILTVTVMDPTVMEDSLADLTTNFQCGVGDFGCVNPGGIVPPPPPPPGGGPLPGSADQDVFVVAGGPGSPGEIFVFNQGGLLTTLSPFATAPGGIRAVVADVTGDGVPDIIAGTGPGTVNRVVVFDGMTMRQIAAMTPFEGGYSGGVYLAADDVDGDGIADIGITPDEGGGARLRLFSGALGEQLADFFVIADPNFRGGARLAMADLNGDGFADIIGAAGFQGGPRVALFDGREVVAGNTSDSAKFTGDFFVFEQTLRNGVNITAGDVTGDGNADLIVGGGPGGAPRVFGLSGAEIVRGVRTQIMNFFAGDVSNRGGVRLAVKDLDGDPNRDLIVATGEGADSQVISFAGGTITANGTPAVLSTLDPFGGFSNGVFVG